MSDILLTLFYFFIAFSVFIKIWKYLSDYYNKKAFSESIDVRMKELILKQELLYGPAETSKHMSAFSYKEKQKLEEMLSVQHGFLDEVRSTLKRSGIKMSITQLVSACLSGGIAFTAFLIEIEAMDLYLCVPVGMAVGIFLIYSLLSYQASLKKKAFLQQFPDAIDMMIRGVKAGLNLSRLIRLVSAECKDPIAGEFRIMLQKLELGVPPEKVFIDAANDVDIEEFRFLSVAFILQLENGGMLVEILGNLSGIVRKRLELQLKMRAMSSESRMSAIILCALPFVFAGIMLVMNPDHLNGLVNSSTGLNLLKICIALFFFGVVSMFKITKMKV